MQEFDWLNVNALIGDYLAGLGHLTSPSGRNLYVFLGSTIGNFAPEDATAFLRDLRTHMHSGDYLLIGVDRVKDTSILEAAYNDVQGITAQFNLNLLKVLNRELSTDFVTTQFRHEAIFNEVEQQIEMYLISRSAQRVDPGMIGTPIELENNEKNTDRDQSKIYPAATD